MYYTGYNYCKENNLPFHCLYFAHEESVEKFWITISCDLIKERYNLDLTYYQYKGFHPGFTQDHRKALDSIQSEINDLKKCIHVFDYVSNPTGMYKTVQKFMDTIGKRTDGIIETDDFGNKYQSFEYEFTIPDTQVVVVNDHIGLVTPEKNPYEVIDTVHKAMKKWSEYEVKFIAKKYKCICVDVHQQEMMSDGAENIRMGRPEPSIDKLGTNKIIAQNYYVLLGIFNPTRVKPPMANYGGYSMKDFNGHFRTIHVLKHRDGDEGVIKPMYFHGVSSRYEELPKPNTTELTTFINKIKKSN